MCVFLFLIRYLYFVTFCKSLGAYLIKWIKVPHFGSLIMELIHNELKSTYLNSTSAFQEIFMNYFKIMFAWMITETTYFVTKTINLMA